MCSVLWEKTCFRWIFITAYFVCYYSYFYAILLDLGIQPAFSLPAGLRKHAFLPLTPIPNRKKEWFCAVDDGRVREFINERKKKTKTKSKAASHLCCLIFHLRSRLLFVVYAICKLYSAVQCTYPIFIDIIKLIHSELTLIEFSVYALAISGAPSKHVYWPDWSQLQIFRFQWSQMCSSIENRPNWNWFSIYDLMGWSNHKRTQLRSERLSRCICQINQNQCKHFVFFVPFKWKSILNLIYLHVVAVW